MFSCEFSEFYTFFTLLDNWFSNKEFLFYPQISTRKVVDEKINSTTIFKKVHILYQEFTKSIYFFCVNYKGCWKRTQHLLIFQFNESKNVKISILRGTFSENESISSLSYQQLLQHILQHASFFYVISRNLISQCIPRRLSERPWSVSNQWSPDFYVP